MLGVTREIAGTTWCRSVCVHHSSDAREFVDEEGAGAECNVAVDDCNPVDARKYYDDKMIVVRIDEIRRRSQGDSGFGSGSIGWACRPSRNMAVGVAYALWMLGDKTHD